MTTRTSAADPRETPLRLAVAALQAAAAIALAGCDEGSSSDCKNNDDCDSGEVCNLLTGQCIRDAVDLEELHFTGTFDCTVAAFGEGNLAGRSDVAGKLDDQTLRLDDVGCELTPDADALRVSLFGTARSSEGARVRPLLALESALSRSFDDTALDVVTEFPVAMAGNGEVEVTLGFSMQDQIGAELGDVLLIATGDGGEVRLTGDSRLGSELSGVVDVRVRMLGTRGVGEACTAFEDCDVNLELACYEAFGSICTKTCETQDDCDAVDATCTFLQGVEKGFCLLPCTDDGDCSAEGFACANRTRDEGVCTPGFFGKEDPDFVGNPCSGAEDCPATACLTTPSSDTGMCTLPCSSSDDCWLYLDIEAICVAVDADDSVCLQRCQDADECPSGLVCADWNGERVCRLPGAAEPADAGVDAATPEPDAGTGLPPSPNLGVALRRLAQLDCELTVRCSELVLQIVGGDEAYCAEQVENYYSWLSALPGTDLTIEEIDACAERYTELSCEQWHDPMPDCELIGTRANGQPCADNGQCTSGWCQATTYSCGTCAPTPLAGAPCTHYSQCPSGMDCIGDECVVLGLENQACDDQSPCFGAFLTCVAGRCVHNERTLNQTCGPAMGQPYCDQEQASLGCSAQGTCLQATVADPGEPCPSFGWCSGRGQCVSTLCEAGPGPGDVCSDTTPCRWPAVCIASECVGLPAGDPCSASP